MGKKTLCAFLVACVLCLANVTFADWDTKGEAYQACSAMTLEQAQNFKETAEKTIQGLRVRITTRTLESGQQIHDIFLSHPDMSPNQIRQALGDASCGPVGRECN